MSLVANRVAAHGIYEGLTTAPVLVIGSPVEPVAAHKIYGWLTMQRAA